jgi:hypothetical protein
LTRAILVPFISLVLQSCSFTDEPFGLFSISVQVIFSAAYSTDRNHVLAGSIQCGGSLWDVKNAERLFN